MSDVRSKVLRLLKDSNVRIHNLDLPLPKGTELEIFGGIVYMGGYPLSQDYQSSINAWIDANIKDKTVFLEIFR